MTELTLLLIGMFVLWCISFILSKFDFYSPSFIVCTMFILSSMLALYAKITWQIPDTYFSVKATIIMLSGVMVFIFFEQLTKRITKSDKKSVVSSEYIRKPIHISTYKFIVLLLLVVLEAILFVRGTYNKVRVNGYTGNFDFSAIAKYNHKLSFQNELEGGIGRSLSILQDAAKYSMYLCMYIFFHNIIYCKEKIIKNLKFLIPIIAWLPNILITSSRGSYLQLAGACAFFYYIMFCRQKNWKKKKKNYFKTIKYAVIFFVTMLLLFYTAAATGVIGRKTNKNFIDNITIYVGAPVIHFHQFISDPPANIKYFGQETFNKLLRVYKKLGLINELVSGQMEVRKITNNHSGNVYTFFRRPYHDFGVLGMYIIVALTAISFSYVYYNNIYGKYRTYKNDRTLIFYSYFFYIIYIFSIDCALYLYVYFGIIYFLIAGFLLYDFIFSKRNSHSLVVSSNFLRLKLFRKK